MPRPHHVRTHWGTKSLALPFSVPPCPCLSRALQQHQAQSWRSVSLQSHFCSRFPPFGSLRPQSHFLGMLEVPRCGASPAVSSLIS